MSVGRVLLWLSKAWVHFLTTLFWGSLKSSLAWFSNPYIPTNNYYNLDNQTLYDPKIALDGGEDGIFYYIKILNFLIKVKFSGDIFFEIDPIITIKLEKFLLEKSIKIVYKKVDYQNLDRLIKITFPWIYWWAII